MFRMEVFSIKDSLSCIYATMVNAGWSYMPLWLKGQPPHLLRSSREGLQRAVMEEDNVSEHVPEVNSNVDNADDRCLSIRPIDIRQAQPLGWEAGIEVFTGGDPFLAMIHAIAVEQGYSKGALAVLMSDLPESMLDVKALPAKHHRLALDAEVKEAREAAESKATSKVAPLDS